jgi:hypothetical protein
MRSNDYEAPNYTIVFGFHLKSKYSSFQQSVLKYDCLYSLVIRVSGYRSKGPGFNSRRFHIF